MALYPSAVVAFTDVYNKSMCRPREMLVEVHQEYPDDIEHIFIPSCVVLMRCAGCCNDEMLECTPTATRNITLEVRKLLIENLRENLDCLSALFVPTCLLLTYNLMFNVYSLCLFVFACCHLYIFDLCKQTALCKVLL